MNVFNSKQLKTYSQLDLTLNVDVLRVVGRHRKANNVLEYSWPGVFFEVGFQGSGIAFKFRDFSNNYKVYIDDILFFELECPGNLFHVISGLDDCIHSIKISKTTESKHLTSRFFGFSALGANKLIPSKSSSSLQFEFIGDSFTAGYGLDRSNEKQDVDLAFPTLLAEYFKADYHVNAISGIGIVRNYCGYPLNENIFKYIERIVQADTVNNIDESMENWSPDLLVINLGINDFYFELNPSEPWTKVTLFECFVEQYMKLVDYLYEKYGLNIKIILVSFTTDVVCCEFSDAVAKVAESSSGLNHVVLETVPMCDITKHPTVLGQKRIKEQLVEVIESMLKDHS